MEEYPFQASIVGRTVIPKQVRQVKWGFLTTMAKELRPGQAIRLVLPKAQSESGARISWYNLLKSKGHTRRVKQPDGSIILYLWCD